MPRYDRHLLSDSDGLFPAEFNTWELEVLTQEAKRDDFLAWYRNPPSASPESLGITYPDDGDERIMRPDFVFFSKVGEDEVQANIVDPHGQFLADSLPKLIGLSDYAVTYEQHYGQIEAVAKVDDGFRVLDLQDASVREAIRMGPSAKALFSGPVAKPYPV